ncbi:MAG TPA: DJ-1/PfpI family protein [Thermoanaerobaculia bacterium]|nr:DJ-1/PfpI family protein [Thermoanaerobaculia bacterium]
MKRNRSGRISAAAFVLALAASLAVLGLGPGAAPAAGWVCAPCDMACDQTVYDEPGTCPKCGLKLVRKEAADRAKETSARPKVAILVFDGVQIIDSMGPYEVFGASGFEVYTVGRTKTPVTTAMGLTIVPRYDFADAPAPAVLVVPGGGVRGARESEATLRFVRETTARAQHTLSVCNGAFILGSAGLLDGLSATTTAGLVGELRAEFPKTRVVGDRRFVDNGKIVTAGGLSAGIDGALHVVARMMGDATAARVAVGEEYDWHPEGTTAARNHASPR